MMRPITAIIVITTHPPFPRAIAKIWTKGCGASNANKVSRSGVQNRNKIAVANPKTPVAIALENIPRAATTLKDVIRNRT